ncbi:MAG: hypothetical protein GY865_12220 [candidate division Zixibacteria bacterium]|nr:hypothetical protein [candidate division Zixibacteria bacterium]
MIKKNNIIAIFALIFVAAIIADIIGDSNENESYGPVYAQSYYDDMPDTSQVYKDTKFAIRAILGHDKFPEKGYGAYGYLVFVRKPDSLLMERYLLICESFKRLFFIEEDFSEYDLDKKMLFPTYWLLDSIPPNSEDVENCKWLVNNYNYPRAFSMASKIKKTSLEGPILIACSQRFEDVDSTSQALILDMSKFENGDIDRAFEIWKERITKDPTNWNNGFNLSMIREHFRIIVNRYGEDILSILKEWV